ncbi:MAG TPA: hypothetical protein VFR47_14095 [Anaerolineales bacterium]|nr:hypothetical protein [Anaerolineales bacterium]
MTEKSRKQAVLVLTLRIISISACALAVYEIVPTLGIVEEFEGEHPTGAVDSVVVYAINPETILASIGSDETELFMPLPSETETDTSQWLAKSYYWNDKEFMKVANALHQFVWNESLEKWSLYKAHYRIFQCQDESSRFEAADFIYFRRYDNYYLVHTIWINPFNGEVGTGYTNYEYTGKRKAIDFDKADIKNASAALKLSEDNGGRDAQLKDINGCSVDISLAPYAFKHNFLPIPFSRTDWGWHAVYTNDNSEIIFEIVIDPYTGRYKTAN